MPITKQTKAPWWEKYSVSSYADFADYLTNGSLTMSNLKRDYALLPAQWRAFYDKAKQSLDKTGFYNPTQNRVTASQAAKEDVGKSAAIIQRNQYANQLATIKKNLLAALDSQKIYNSATNKTNLKDYTSTISSLRTEMEKIQAALAKLK